MEYKRIHVRVPIIGEVQLTSDAVSHVRALAIDISQGGVAITDPSLSLAQGVYGIKITTADGRDITMTGELIRQDETVAGFKTTDIDPDSLEIITDLIFQYQKTTDFIKQIEEHNLFDNRFVDDDGNELDVTFDVDPPKS